MSLPFYASTLNSATLCSKETPLLPPPRQVKPKVKVSPSKSGAQAHPNTLVCSMTEYYSGRIEVKWLKNGQEQTAGVVSTELMQNGDWTFQILVMLEMTPRSGDVYTCQVEHSGLSGPVTMLWEAQAGSARSKMLMGVGGFILGLTFLAPGLLIYLRNKKDQKRRCPFNSNNLRTNSMRSLDGVDHSPAHFLCFLN
ncbi:HLA class II histocompatibility antigen, DP beta 1 chain-like [Alligator sinensis]|uniref:HLA class II histocompatibility antigen, DP beta 1 chain-like n=1 Tax=Alligator sinensis TaxID=38654 RepID=A0A3Q0HPE9_ALLSI|nr:HLA class II histocompatibility antigen, DP beta 1 chain-like [Alligator sinensis]